MFCGTFNNLFDVLNSWKLSNIEEKNPVTPESFFKTKTNLLSKLHFLLDLKLENAQKTPVSESKSKTVVFGFATTILSAIELRRTFEEKLVFIVGVAVQQDPLEHFFSLSIRFRCGVNNKPTAIQLS